MESVLCSEFPGVCMAVRGVGQGWVISWWGKTKQLYSRELQNMKHFLGTFLYTYWLNWLKFIWGNLKSFGPFPCSTLLLKAYLWDKGPFHIHLYIASDGELTTVQSSQSHIQTAWSHYSFQLGTKNLSPERFYLGIALWSHTEHIISSFSWQAVGSQQPDPLVPSFLQLETLETCSFIDREPSISLLIPEFCIHSVNYLRCSQEGLRTAWGSSDSWSTVSDVICQLREGQLDHHPHSGCSDTHFSWCSLTVSDKFRTMLLTQCVYELKS